MEDKDKRTSPLCEDQLLLYAQDFSEVYKSEKSKRDELERINQQLYKYAEDLNQTVGVLKKANDELKEAYIDTVNRLALAAEFKDEDTGDHIIRVSEYSAFLAKKLGLNREEVEIILYATPMHDIGKVGISDDILLKKGKLTPDEFITMKTHTIIGANILSNSKSKIIQVAELIAMTHHEKWDGNGYPRGLKGTGIPIYGRIVAIADVFDALTSRRPYKEPYPLDIALEIIKQGKGTNFDPMIVNLFFEFIDDVLEIRNRVGSDVKITPGNIVWSERDLKRKTA
ncbi:MAG: HD-GYP domain-containing protein [Vulcanimicrobiota bacterium]